jgi:hypothetical protein
MKRGVSSGDMVAIVVKANVDFGTAEMSGSQVRSRADKFAFSIGDLHGYGSFVVVVVVAEVENQRM